MIKKNKSLNEEIVEIKKWMGILNEANLIGVGHFPNETMNADYRESYSESTELSGLGTPESEMSGYMEESVINEYIRHRDNKWVVVSKKGKTLGTHTTRQDALNQLRAIEANK
jgi:hypothetical protein